VRQNQGVRCDSAGKSNVALPRVLRWFWALSVVAAGLTPLVAYLERLAGMTKEYWDPLQYPMFADLMEYVPTFRLLHTAAFFHDPHVSAFAYPPFAAVLFALMYGCGHPIALYLAIASIALIWMIAWARRCLVREGISRVTATAFMVSVALASFPLARLLPQGNVELILWIGVIAGLWLHSRGRDDAAAVLWGLAAAIKLYPLALLLLFLGRWRWRAIAVGVLTFAGSTRLSLLYMGPSVREALAGSLQNVFGYQNVRVGQWTMNIVATNHSLFTLVKLAATLMGISFAKLTMPYYICAGLLFVAVYLIRLRKMPFENQLLAVSLMMVMLPTVSYFHTLVHLYAPWLLLALLAVRAERTGVRIPGLTTVILLMSPLFVSYTLYTFRSVFLFGGFIQAILLCFLMLYALQYRFELPPSGEPRRMEQNGGRA
jgi:hypothetical protein